MLGAQELSHLFTTKIGTKHHSRITVLAPRIWFAEQYIAGRGSNDFASLTPWREYDFDLTRIVLLRKGHLSLIHEGVVRPSSIFSETRVMEKCYYNYRKLVCVGLFEVRGHKIFGFRLIYHSIMCRCLWCLWDPASRFKHFHITARTTTACKKFAPKGAPNLQYTTPSPWLALAVGGVPVIVLLSERQYS